MSAYFHLQLETSRLYNWVVFASIIRCTILVTSWIRLQKVCLVTLNSILGIFTKSFKFHQSSKYLSNLSANAEPLRGKKAG